jgi:predicted thioesterase
MKLTRTITVKLTIPAHVGNMTHMVIAAAVERAATETLAQFLSQDETAVNVRVAVERES